MAGAEGRPGFAGSLSIGARPAYLAGRVTVYTRVGCPACEKAEADVARICGELGHTWRAVDVDTDPDLRAEYGDRVPVIDIDGREHGFWKVEEPRFRGALARSAR